MGNQLTNTIRRVVAGACLAVACACSGADPDPRSIATSFEPRRLPPPDRRPQLAVAHFRVDSPVVPAAPAGETAPRAPDAPPRATTILLGRRAAATGGEALVQAFVATQQADGAAVVAGTDRDAAEGTALGRGDFGLMAGAPSPHDVQQGLHGTRLGVELFALTVAPGSPVRSLTHQQVRQVFTGQAKTWRDLGLVGGDIVAVVPAEPALAERAARTLIPGDEFAASCIAVASERHVADQLLQHAGAIGIVRVTAAPREAGQKLLPIDWCPPTAEAFEYGTYPFGLPVTLVTIGAPRGAARDFLAFARSAAGRELLGRSLALQP